MIIIKVPNLDTRIFESNDQNPLENPFGNFAIFRVNAMKLGRNNAVYETLKIQLFIFIIYLQL